MRRSAFLSFLFAVALAFSWPPMASAHDDAPGNPLDAARFDQRLGAQLPLDLRFRDEAGATVRLGDYFGRRPVVLILAYYHCPNLCPLALDALAYSLRQLPFEAGKEFDVLAVSISPRDTAALASERKAEVLRRYGRPGGEDGWHLLTGEHDAVDALADAVGFRFAYDAAQDQYAHPEGLLLLTPEGSVARYLYGIEHSATDLRLGLVEASQGKIGSPVDQVLLRCYDYNPQTGTYSLAILRLVRVAGVGAAASLGATLFAMLRRGNRSGRSDHTDSSPLHFVQGKL